MKTTIKNISLATFALLLIGIKANAQDERFSQPFSQPLRYNPAIMGANTDMKFQLNYRSQWANVEKGYTTYAFNAMLPFYLNAGKNKFDAGVSVLNDKAGAFSKLDAMVAIDYNLKIAENNYFSFALSGGFIQRSLSTSGLTYDNQYVLGTFNSTNPNNELTLGQKVGFADVGFGMMWYMNPSRDKSKLNAYAGVAGYHLNQANESQLGNKGQLPMRITYEAGIKIMGNGKIDVTPNIRYNSQKGNHEMAAGIYVDYVFSDNAKLVVGSWYRQNDAIAFLLGFEHKSFTFGYSYDVVSSSITGNMASINANEISIGYKFSRLSKSDSENKNPSVASSPFESF